MSILTPLLGFTLAFQPVAPPSPDVDDTVVRRLIDALKDPDTEVRQNLAAALSKVGAAAVEPLIEALRNGPPEQRAGAAYTLGLIGQPARVALPALLDALADKETDVRRQASYSISRLIQYGRPAAASRSTASKTPPSPTGGKQP